MPYYPIGSSYVYMPWCYIYMPWYYVYKLWCYCMCQAGYVLVRSVQKEFGGEAGSVGKRTK